jgi:hypothetical protein
VLTALVAIAGVGACLAAVADFSSRRTFVTRWAIASLGVAFLLLSGAALGHIMWSALFAPIGPPP